MTAYHSCVTRGSSSLGHPSGPGLLCHCPGRFRPAALLSFPVALILLAVAAPSAASAAEPDPELAKKALAILDKTCSRCHGKDGRNEGGVDYILDVKKLIDKRKLVPGAAEKSRLYLRVVNGDMPCDGEQPRPTKEQIALLKVWIDGGDPSAAPPVVAEKDRKSSLSDIPEEAFPTLTDMPRVPEATDSVAMDLPPACSPAVSLSCLYTTSPRW